MLIDHEAIAKLLETAPVPSMTTASESHPPVDCLANASGAGTDLTLSRSAALSDVHFASMEPAPANPPNAYARVFADTNPGDSVHADITKQHGAQTAATLRPIEPQRGIPWVSIAVVVAVLVVGCMFAWSIWNKDTTNGIKPEHQASADPALSVDPADIHVLDSLPPDEPKAAYATDIPMIAPKQKPNFDKYFTSL